jgi:predicted RNase H-like nuclease (RuvC/YqgF family)
MLSIKQAHEALEIHEMILYLQEDETLVSIFQTENGFEVRMNDMQGYGHSTRGKTKIEALKNACELIKNERKEREEFFLKREIEELKEKVKELQKENSELKNNASWIKYPEVRY